ncbi:class I SAM-dependent methyltransferase [Rubricoccus marinus]|uniref:Methyltransferase domain-containing protein n=1 Tax=Rubricoccus marinus TaxID=716817 RepID=A0A259TX90_9BACT|nr:class I SAM-dependent methyltransferase [Rubricoccus marinus]OZC02375.1 hypothetical protein BSZ36_04915 [Rubricoccus marinus]
MREYDEIAGWYARVRDANVGAVDVLSFARRLPPEARVLDLGCGDGVPVSQLLLREGFEVIGLDSSAEMIARFRARFPDVTVRRERAQEATFAAGAFNGVVAWGMLFHLSPEDQRATIEKVSGWLASGGRFLFTSGGEAGEIEGEMDGVRFRYISLGVDGYREALERTGMHLEREYRDAWDNHVYLAVKPLAPEASGAQGA